MKGSDIFLPVVMLTLFICNSCVGASDGAGEIIHENSSWRVTTSSYSDSEKSISFTSDSAIMDFPVCVSPTPLLDRLYAAGVNDYFADASPILFHTGSSCNLATLALLDPELLSEVVMMAARRGKETRRDWPLEADELSWIRTARDLYIATGDETIRDTIVPVARDIIDREVQVALDKELSLFRGLLPEIPSSISRNDVMAVISLYVNIDRVSAIRALGELLGDDGEYYLQLAQKLTSSINDRFWIPEKGRYGCALWGEYYPILVTASDNLAQSMAINQGIATPEMAASILTSMPLTDEGSPDIFPVPGHHQPIYSLSSQLALYTAASKMHNEQGALLGLSAATASAFGDITNTGDTRGAVTAAMLQSLAGISFSNSGMDISPFVPEIFPGEKTFSSLIFRGDTLDIHVIGTGSRVARMEIDGIPANTVHVPDSITGRHRIDVIMANNTSATRSCNIVSPVTFPPRPDLDSISRNEFIVTAPSKNYSYAMAVNGIACKMISDGAFTVSPSPSGTKFVTAMSVDREGFSSLPATPRMIFNPKDTIVVSRHAIPHDLRKAVASRVARNSRRNIRRREVIPTHLELTGILNTDLTVNVNAPTSGEYFIDIVYWRPSVIECFITDLCMGDSIIGCFMLPAQRGVSNPLTVNLHKGRNKIKLLYHPLPSGNLQSGACLEYIRFLPKKISKK